MSAKLLTLAVTLWYNGGMMLRSFLFLFSLLAAGTACLAQEADQRILERYWEILTKSPKRSVAFDRVYGHYVDLGQSAALYQDCQMATQEHPTDASTWLLFGLVAERRNKNEQAVGAFQKAAALEPASYLPLLYLGELLLNQRRVHEAIMALEQAKERLQNNAGNRNDQRTVMQALALAYERFGNSQKSLDVWNQLARLFPNDPDILVHVAETMEFDGKLDEALKQYRRLIDITDDHAERIRLSLAAIDIMIRQGSTDSKGDPSALDDLDSLLGLVDTESYLADAVRDRIDRIFERDRDKNRQIEFYQKRIEQEPNDTASLLRLVKTYHKAEKIAEAEKLLHATIKSSPSNIALRLALVDLLVERNDINGAVEQFQAIDKIVPTQTDYLIRWGTLVLRNPAMNESARRAEATKIWSRITDKSPHDPVAAVQVADLFFRSRFYDEAEQHYKKAMELRPVDFSYRESLAMFYHQQRRKEKVLETLLPVNVRHREETGQLLLTLGYLDEATSILRESAQASPQNWTLQIRFLEVLLRRNTVESMQEARELLVNVEKCIVGDEQFSLYLQQEVQLLKLLQKVSEVVKIVQAGSESSPSVRSLWHLAVLHHAEANFASAIVAVELAGAGGVNPLASLSESGGISPPLMRFAAELYEHAGNTSKAVALYQKLVQDDPARSGEYWKQIISLQVQRGELPQALESSQQLLGHGTENAERLRFVADLFLSVNRRTEATKLLRQALVYEPGNTDVLRILAQTLTDAEQHEEAVELLWRLYDRLELFSAKLSVIELLATEYNRMGKFEELVELLRLWSRNYERRRESLQALVRVFMIRGEYEEAQNVLETLLDLPEENRTESEFESLWVLRELVGVSEKQNDFESAVRYQELLCQKSSDVKEQNLLFHLYDKLGNTAKTKKMFLDQILQHTNLRDRLDLIDTMIRREQYEAVSQVLDFLEMHEQEHWEISFRRILTEAHQNKSVESLVREFRSKRFEDTPSASVSAAGDSATNSQLFLFYDITDTAPEDVRVALTIQRQFLPILFHPEIRRFQPATTRQFSGAGSWGQGLPFPFSLPGGIAGIQTYRDARFLALGFLLREAMHKDFTTRSDNPTVMRQFRNTVEELRDKLPVDSTKYDVLMERLRLEVLLLDCLAFDNQNKVFSTGILKLQIDERVCQQTKWQIVRNVALDGIPEWQSTLFQILIVECINELVAHRFQMAADSDVKLSEKLTYILDNLCFERKIPPIPAEDRNKMINQATYLVKRSTTDHEESLRYRPLTLSQKTDRLLSIWSEYIEHADVAVLQKYQHYFTSRYETLLWILHSQNRESDIASLTLSVQKTSQSHPLWFAMNLSDFTQPIDDDSILFLSLSGFDSLESQLQRIKNVVPSVRSLLTGQREKREFCELLFQHIRGLLHESRLQRYDIFTSSERALFGLSTSQIWNHLQVPSTLPQGQFIRQFFSIDPSYAAHQQILNADQMSRLVELERSLQQFADFAFFVLGELKLEPSDLMPSLTASAGQQVSLAKYRLELQGDRPIDRTLIYSLLQNRDAVSNFSGVDELFCQLMLLRRALDTKTKFAGTRTDNRLIPLEKNYLADFNQFLDQRNRSSVSSDRSWSNYISSTFDNLLQSNQAQTTPTQGSDPEMPQLALKLQQRFEDEKNGQALSPAEQLALTLLYVRLQRFADAVALLDSMELSTSPELSTREWLIAGLAMKQARTDQVLAERGNEAVDRLLNFRLSERDSWNLVPVLQHFNRPQEAHAVLDHLIATVSDRRLLAELFYKMAFAGEEQKENAAKAAQRILKDPTFLQNSRRLTPDVLLFTSTVELLQKQDRLDTVMPVLENRLRGLRDKTDALILTATLYTMLDREDEAKTLALELAANPTAEPERRQMIVSLLLRFGLHRELEAMNRLLLEWRNAP